jgi:uncharacterized membrane protein (DUF485 family)
MGQPAKKYASPTETDSRRTMPEPIRRFETSKTEWDRIAATQEFQDLMATKKVFIVPAFIFFIVYYFALPILVGYAPTFMATKVIGNVNLAYLFALSQFFMAWTIAFLYVKAAGDFDRLAKDIIERAEASTSTPPNSEKEGR